MDTGEGKFTNFIIPKDLEEQKEKFPNHGGIFRIGETVKLKGSRFRIKSIKPTELRLKLLKKIRRGKADTTRTQS